jgi:hypothetical protein
MAVAVSVEWEATPMIELSAILLFVAVVGFVALVLAVLEFIGTQADAWESEDRQ